MLKLEQNGYESLSLSQRIINQIFRKCTKITRRIVEEKLNGMVKITIVIITTTIVIIKLKLKLKRKLKLKLRFKLKLRLKLKPIWLRTKSLIIFTFWYLLEMIIMN